MEICLPGSLLILFLFCKGLAARDINLDNIYIKKTSPDYKLLILEKLDTYKKISAAFVDNDVIFADWISGNELIYIKENISLNTNYVFRFRLRDRSTKEICRLSGAVTVAKTTLNSKYLILKRLVQAKSIIPKGEMLIIGLQSGDIRKIKTSYGFLDFSITPDGNSILIENSNGIVELSLENKSKRLLVKKKEYSDIIISGNPCVAYISPDMQKFLIINGSGGNYRGKLLLNKYESIKIDRISSSSEVLWQNNFNIVYRTGYAGNFSVVSYNVKNNRKSYLLKKSFNTNITFSKYSETVTFLKEQLIHLYDNSKKKVVNTGLEGEDVSFEPNGNRFIALLYKKLFIVNRNKIQKKHIELKRSWKLLYSLYNNMVNKKQYFKNSYTGFYIDRKIAIYRDLAGI